MVYKTWCTIRQKLASFLWDASSKELVKIGEDEYYEERIIERDDKRYVLLRSVADPTAALVRRICEYYETIEDETELQGTLKEFKIQCDLTKRKSKNRCLAFIIAVVILTVAAIVGNSWLIRNWESSVFEHELICYCLIAVCVCMVNNRVCKRKSITASVLFTSGFAIVFSILVFLLNNWWRYLYENTRFYWNFQNGWYWPFSAVLKSDIKYSIGIGKYRYWLVFFAAEIGLLVEMVSMREVSKKSKPSI